MDIIELAVASGMQITLDARIGTQEYKSVYGSLQALRRFAEAIVIAAPFVGNSDVPSKGDVRACSSGSDKNGGAQRLQNEPEFAESASHVTAAGATRRS